MKAVQRWGIWTAAALAALCLRVGASGAEAPKPEPLISPDEMLSVSQIHPGMKGYGRSVFQGTKIERFDVTVLGVLKKIDYGGDMILVRIDDGYPVTSKSGVSAGMSGSPIYVDGKLVGALAFAWPFAKDPVAGVTPIAQMLEVYQPGSAPKQPVVASTGDLLPADGPLKLDGQLFARASVVPERGLAPVSSTGTMYLTPVATPIMMSGMGRAGIEDASKRFSRYSAMALPGPGKTDLPPSERPKLEPGAAIGVQMLSGDIDATAIGTVTYVKGDHVLAFGHPMMGLGSIDMPMTTAYIHGIISSQQVSFKMGSPVETVGHITQDRNWSIGGRVGQPAKTIQAEFVITDKDRGVQRDYYVQAAVHRELSPGLIYETLVNAINSVSPPSTGTTRGVVEVWPHGMPVIRRENVFSMGEKPTGIEQLFADPFASMPLAELFQILTTLEDNHFGTVPVDKIKVSVDVSEQRRTATVERAYTDRKRVKPGDKVKVGVVIRPTNGPKVTEDFELQVPANIPAGKLQIGVGGGSSADRVRQYMQITKPSAQSLPQLLAQLSDHERNSDLTVEVAQPVVGINVSGREFPNLPNVVVEVLASSSSSGIRVARSHNRQTRTTPWVLSGAALLSLDVEADEKDKSGPLAVGGFGAPGGAGSILDLLRMGLGAELGASPDGPDAGALFGGGGDEGDSEEAARRILPRALGALRAAAGATKPGPVLPDDAKMPSFTELEQISRGEGPDVATGGEADAGAVTATKKGTARAPGVWRMSSVKDFEPGKLDGTLISSRGEIALAPEAKSLLSTPDRFFWAQTTDRDGNVYVGGWLNGIITRINTRGESSVFYNNPEEVAISALAAGPDGTIYAAAEPSGHIYRIGADGKAKVFCTLEGQRVWALKMCGQTLFAGTGSEGRLYQIAKDGTVTLRFTAPDRHIFALAEDGKGTLYCGTYPRGKVFRITATSAEPLYELPNMALTALAVDGKGNVFVGTSPRAGVVKITPAGEKSLIFQAKERHVLSLVTDESGAVYAGVGGTAKVYRIAPDKTVSTLWDPKASYVLSLSKDAAGNLYATTAGPTEVVRLSSAPASTGTFTSQVMNAGTVARWGAVRWNGTSDGVRIQTRTGNTGYPDATWSAWSEAYTKPSGQPIVSPAAQYLQYRVQLQNGKAPPTIREVDLFYRTRNRPPDVTVKSPTAGEVLSGTRPIRWTAKDPDGDRLTYDVYFAREGSDVWTKIGTRSGKSPAADENEAPQKAFGGAPAAPQARAIPVTGPGYAAAPRTAVKGSVAAARMMRMAKAPSTAAKPKPATSSGPKPKPEASAAPDAAAVDFSFDDSADEGTSINWNTRRAPDGRYRVKIVASDALTSPDEPMTAEVLSEVVQVDNTAPKLLAQNARRIGPAPPMEIAVEDEGTYVASAEYRIDNGEWIAAAAVDGIFDSPQEAIKIDPKRLKSGKHTLEIRARDAAGNESTTKVSYVLTGVSAPKKGK